jgi:hypothetical protein
MSYLHKVILVVLLSTFALVGCETTTHAQEGQVIGAVPRIPA